MVEHEGDLRDPVGSTTLTWNVGEDDAPPRLPERWELLANLGSGGQATVWLAEDRVLGQRVALKVFRRGADPAAQRRWTREVRFGRELHHPHLIRLYDLIDADGATIAIMEWVSGGSIGQKVALDGPQPIPDVVRWCRQALDVLSYLHARRIVHRDVKPSNLLLDESGDLRLADLGLVRPLEIDDGLTRTRTGLGTPSYMAPEQLRGGPPSPSWDLYALGVTAYQLLTGRRPHAGDSEFATFEAQIRRAPIRVRRLRGDCPRWLARFVGRLLERRPEDRWPSAVEARAAFERQRAGLAPARVRRRVAGVGLAIALAAAATAGVWRLVSADPGPVEVDVVGERVQARDRRGEVLWHREFPGRNPRALVGDLSPIQGRETVVLASPEQSDDGPAPAEVVVVSAGGEVLWSRPAGDVQRRLFPRFSPVWQATFPQLADVDADGWDEIVYAVSHPLWFPTEVHVSDLEIEAMLRFPHSGRLDDLDAVDIDGDGRMEIIGVGVNNRLGFQRVVFIAATHDRLTGRRCLEHRAPELAAAADGRPAGSAGCLSYTVLGARWSRPQIRVSTTLGEISVGEGDDLVRLDRWGNRIDGPLGGVGPEPRHRFWRDVAGACARLRLRSRNGWRDSVDDLRSRHPELTADAPHLAAAAFLLGNALAEAGRHAEAAELYEENATSLGHQPDLWLRAGEQRLILGQRDRGRALVRRSLPVSRQGRNAFDQLVMLALDAAVFGDDADLDRALELTEVVQTAGGRAHARAIRAIALFFDGEFADPRLAGQEPVPVMPWVELAAAWAELERTGDTSTAAARARALAGRSEIGELSELLLAAAELRRGRPDEAHALADETVRTIERVARTSFETFAWLPLARLVREECRLAMSPDDVDVDALRWVTRRSPGTFVGRRAARVLAQHGQ